MNSKPSLVRTWRSFEQKAICEERNKRRTLKDRSAEKVAGTLDSFVPDSPLFLLSGLSFQRHFMQLQKVFSKKACIDWNATYDYYEKMNGRALLNAMQGRALLNAIGEPVNTFPEKVAVQMIHIHPTLCIPELMRNGFEWFELEGSVGDYSKLDLSYRVCLKLPPFYGAFALMGAYAYE
ncbi:hypothetical protein ACSBR2_039823 [Camellia fascicularis]